MTVLCFLECKEGKGSMVNHDGEGPAKKVQEDELASFFECKAVLFCSGVSGLSRRHFSGLVGDGIFGACVICL